MNSSVLKDHAIQTKSVYSGGQNEGCVSLSWVPDDPLVFFSGTESRWLRCYDTRGHILCLFICFISSIYVKLTFIERVKKKKFC